MRASHRLAVVAASLALAITPHALHADITAGAKVFKQYCAACHSLRPGVNRYAPSLAHLMGRQAGMQPGFEYSAALPRSGIMWNGQTLDRWLRDPHAAVSAGGMPFEGLPDNEQRCDVIEFLEHESAPR